MGASYFPIYINPTFLYLDHMTTIEGGERRRDKRTCLRTRLPVSLLGPQRSEYFRRKAYGGAPYLLRNIAMNALTLS
jgi:hypothetical protein